jgi:hypothetical protein
MKKALLLISVLFAITAFGQGVNLITPNDIQGIQVTRFDTFSASTLPKYVGGNSPLYTEYGFQKLIVCEYVLQDAAAKLEVYLMEDAPAAYGIYSLSYSDCMMWNLYSTFSCINNNKVSAAYGAFYINAVNLSRSSGGRSFCEQLVQLFMAKNTQDNWYLPPLFQYEKVSPFVNTLKYTEGSHGLTTGVPQLAPLLENNSFTCFSVIITNPEYTGTLARIVFPDFNAAAAFLIQAGLNVSGNTTPTQSMDGTYRSWYKVEDTKLIYLESNSPTLKVYDLLPERPSSIW